MFAGPLAVTIRPPLGARAKAARERSISPVSRMLTGVTSTLSGGATAWMAPNWAFPEGLAAFNRHPHHTRSDLLEQLQPFPTHAVFETHETGGIAAWPTQTINEAAGDRIGDNWEHDWHRACRLQQRLHARGAMGENDIRRERN
jgi:hypothetical protein